MLGNLSFPFMNAVVWAMDRQREPPLMELMDEETSKPWRLDFYPE